MTAKEVLKKLKAAGWYEMPGRKTGHGQLKHPERPGKVTVAMHPGDIPKWVLKKIEEQSGVHL
jgi:predicted RNA binding protein YcfA (HicA-like mRNA interferase family)